MAKTKQLRALGGDIFAGLFSVGVKAAGFQLLGHLEHGPWGTATARLNHPELANAIWDHPSAWPGPDSFGHVNFMFTNPPCAAWSTARASKKGTWRDHAERMRIIEHLTTYGLELRPDAWCWESVTNALRHGRGMMDRVAHAWLEAGYHVTIIKQNNMYLGVPQNRPRVLVVAHKYPLIPPPLREPITVREAFAGLRPTKAERAEASIDSPGWEELWKRSGENGHGNFRRIYESLTRDELAKMTRTPGYFARRLPWDAPAPVNLNRGNQFHPREPRHLTWQEILRVCGLPPEWKTSGTIDSGFLELSRAVMPPVGQWLATAVRDGLGKKWPAGVVPDYRLLDISGGLDEDVIDRRLELEPDLSMGRLQAWHEVPAPPIKARSLPAHPTAPRGLGIGAFMRERLAAGDGTEAVLSAVRTNFPTSKATAADVSYQRRKLRQLQEGTTK